jgi:predicted phosphodiesterase
MKFDLMSDLHVDRWGNNQIDYDASAMSDVLVVCGDISDDVGLSAWELAKFANIYEHVIFVDGNHEHEGLGYEHEPRETVVNLRNALSGLSNVHYMADGPIIIDGVGFAGRNGWWDWKIATPDVPSEQSIAEWYTHKESGDHTFISRQALRDFGALAGDVARLDATDTVQSIVVLTHTLPLKQLISWNVYPLARTHSNAYGNSMMHNVLKISPKIKYWLFGHNHDQKNEVIDGVHFISNPRGRPTDFNRIEYSPRQIEV